MIEVANSAQVTEDLHCSSFKLYSLSVNVKHLVLSNNWEGLIVVFNDFQSTTTRFFCAVCSTEEGRNLGKMQVERREWRVGGNKEEKKRMERWRKQGRGGREEKDGEMEETRKSRNEGKRRKKVKKEMGMDGELEKKGEEEERKEGMEGIREEKGRKNEGKKRIG